MAIVQSKALTFQGGSDGNSPDFVFCVKGQCLEMCKVHFDEIKKKSGMTFLICPSTIFRETIGKPILVILRSRWTKQNPTSKFEI